MTLRAHVNIGCVAAQNLCRHKSKTIAISIPLLLVVALFSAMSFMCDGIVKDAMLAAEAGPDITVQKMTGGRIDRVRAGAADRIGRMADVKQVTQRVWGYVPFRTGNRVLTFTLMGLEANGPDVRPPVMGLSLSSGQFLDSSDTNSAIIGTAFAKAMQAKVGDELRLSDEFGNTGTFRVKGLFDSAAQIYAADLIVVPIDAARAFFGYGTGEATDLCVSLDDPLHSDAVSAGIQAELSNIRVLTKHGAKALNRLSYGSRAGVYQLIWMVLMLTVALMAWSEAGSTLMHIRREIGILKAIGWSTLNVIEMKVVENLIVGSLATIGGMTLGLLYVLADAPGIKTYLLGWAAVCPPVHLPLHVEAGSVVLIMVIGIFPLLVATVFPAWAAGVIDPDEAIRS